MACIYTALGLFCLAILYPLIYVLSASVSNTRKVSAGEVWLWPVGFTLDAYKAIFDYKAIVSGFGNSVFYAVAGALVATVLTLLAAYPLSRKGLPGKGLIMAAFVFTMMFNGGLIPTYLVVDQLGLLNTRWAIILPTALAVWNVIITRTYFMVTIPEELVEAGKVDGCSDFGFFWRVVLPLSKPIIAVNLLFYAVGQWNSFFNALHLPDQRAPVPVAGGAAPDPDPVQGRPVPDAGHQQAAADAGTAAAAEVLADRDRDDPAAAGLPVRAEALRQGSHGRLLEGMSR